MLNIISNVLENYRNIKCINKIKRGDFYIIKDSVKKVSRRLGRNYDDSKPVLRVQFTNKHHFFWADENMVIHEKDEYYIILFKKGNYRGGRKTILINPKIIGFYKCKDYDIDYIYNSNIEQFWENGVLYADYMK